MQKQGKTDEIKTTVGLLNERYPDIPVTILANCLTLLDGDAGKVKSMLEGLKPSDFKITTALGMYGVLSIRAEWYEQGTEALEMTIQLGVDSPAERSLLAGVYYSQEEFVKALHAIGRVGHVQGKLSARLLRLRILVALQKTEEAERLASFYLVARTCEPRCAAHYEADVKSSSVRTRSVCRGSPLFITSELSLAN